MRTLLRALSLTLASVAVPLPAATFNVTNTNDTGTGSLRAALTAASASTDEDTINLPNGDYVLATGQFSVSGRVLIQGESSAETVIDGDYQFRVFLLSAGASVEMSNLQITHARSVGSFAYGGAIENFGSLMMTQCRIASCESSAEGGGIANGNTYPSEATTILQQCELTQILGRDGGAVANFGHFVAIDTLFDRNIGNQGAALSNLTAGGDALLVNCTLSNNTSLSNGGAIAHFSNNAGNTLVMVNCTISGNHSGNVGGAMFHYGTPAVTRLFNVTITDNEATNHTGGVYSNIGGCNLSHTIIAGNRSPSAGYSDLGGTVISRGYNLIGDVGSTTFTGPQTGDIRGTTANPIDAHLAPLANYGGLCPTNPPVGVSQAIDGGNPAGAVDNNSDPLLRDQRGVARPQCDAPDIGAVEVVPVTDPEDIIRFLLGLNGPPLCLDVNEDNLLNVADFVALL